MQGNLLADGQFVEFGGLGVAQRPTNVDPMSTALRAEPQSLKLYLRVMRSSYFKREHIGSGVEVGPQCMMMYDYR
jgi:hypothetical protein